MKLLNSYLLYKKKQRTAQRGIKGKNIEPECRRAMPRMNNLDDIRQQPEEIIKDKSMINY